MNLVGGYAKYVETGEVVRHPYCGPGSIGRTITDGFDFTLGFSLVERAHGTTMR